MFCQRCERSQLFLSTVLKPVYLLELSKKWWFEWLTNLPSFHIVLIRFESPPTWKASKTVINWRFSFKWERPRWKAQSLAGKEWSTSPGRSKSSHVTIFEACFSLPWLTMAYYDYLILCITKIKKGEHNCSQFFWHQIKVHRYIHVTVTWMYNLRV